MSGQNSESGERATQPAEQVMAVQPTAPHRWLILLLASATALTSRMRRGELHSAVCSIMPPLLYPDMNT